jgi:hypothetical protein
MRLYHNWRTILRRAWSVRLILLAGVLSLADMMLAFFTEGTRDWRLAAAAAVVSVAALVARLVAQKDV